MIGSESHLRAALASTYYPPRPFFLRLLWRAIHVGAVLALIVGGAVGLQEWAIRSVL